MKNHGADLNSGSVERSIFVPLLCMATRMTSDIDGSSERQKVY